ncbi:MAG: GlsB/YeaQ/YmgE family stress response membrane protein [Nocardioidaceae bacterium]
MDIIGVIIAGIIIGLLGKFVAPGDKDNTPIWLTVLCGIGGVLLGWYVYAAFGGGATSGVDWVRWIVAILVAAALVMIASTVTGRNTSKTSKVKAKFS